MTKSDKLHQLLDGLFRKAMHDGDYSYKPHAIRIDMRGWQLLTRSGEAHADGSFDRFEHVDKYKWRGLETIITHEPVETKIREVLNAAGFDEDLTCEMLCLESRQAGEHGRRKYYDASEDELDEVNA